MIEAPIAFQIDLFTGERVDLRTPAQKKLDEERHRPIQTEMFSQKEVAQFGVTDRPVMALSPGKLVLISQDPRTEEEIEQDLLRQAQSLTIGLFPAVAETVPMSTNPPTIQDSSVDQATTLPDRTPDEEEEDDANDETAKLRSLSKLEAYTQLVHLAEERAATLSASPSIQLSETIRMSAAKFDARYAGLTSAEMTLALQIGEFRGRPKRPNIPLEVPDTTLSQKSKPDEDIPLLWLNRADLCQRRPDLTPIIERLRDDELSFIAEKVGNALEEFYWIQLNVVLSLYLDHALRLTRRVVK
jgi:hypothetical protein